MNVGKRIIYFRELRGITTNKLANLTGLSQSFLRDVELQNKGITIENLALVCESLNVSLQNFFTIPTSEISDKDILNTVSKLTKEQKVKLLEFLNTL